VSLTSLANMRDLAEVRLRHGVLRSGRVYRSDDVSTIDDTEAARLHRVGIRHVLDFRGEPEQQTTGRGPLEQLTSYDHLPFVLAPENDPVHTTEVGPEGLTPEAVGRWYTQVTIDSAEVIIRGLESLTQVEGAAVFHCAAGKDRTGIFAASVLSVLDAPEEEIIADYHASHAALERVFDRLRAAPYGFFLENLPQAGALLRAEAATMEAFLQVARDEHGGLVELLTSQGLREDTIESLRAQLVG